jgi:hypothetical protein
MVASKNGVQAFRQALHLLFALTFSINLKGDTVLVRYITKTRAKNGWCLAFYLGTPVDRFNCYHFFVFYMVIKGKDENDECRYKSNDIS